MSSFRRTNAAAVAADGSNGADVLEEEWAGDIMELSLIVAPILIVAALGWSFAQIRAFDQRLSALENQHLALVAELEEKVYSG